MRHRIVTLLVLLICLLIVFCFQENKLKYPLLITVLSLYAFVISCGVLFLRMNYFLPVVAKFPGKEVLLTFDDGPSDFTSEILAILDKHQIAAVFFVIGKRVEENPELVQRMHESGHIVGNHTQNHPNFFAMYGGKQVADEIEKGNKTISQITQSTKIPFRPPIGYTNPIIANVLRKLRIPVIAWSGRSYDTLYKSSAAMERRLIQLTKPGAIVLLHDSRKITLETLENYIVAAKKNGIIFANRTQLNAFIDEIFRNS
jgi:peptidoglycan-N-acetylglucosamine deacetylase